MSVPDIQQSGIILLLKSALTGRTFELPAGFDFEKAVKVARKHDVSVMLYYGAINCGISSETSIMQFLFSTVCQNIMLNEQQMYEIKRIYNIYEDSAIDYLPLKGSILKELYPKPEMRAMGDADILIKSEQYCKIKEVMLVLGYSAGDESEHELKWHSDSLYLELHKNIISPNNKDYFIHWESPWNMAIKSDEIGHRYKLSDEDTFIHLVTHLAIHYRAGGIGIKHITDIWIYLNSKPDIDIQYIERELAKLKLLDFYRCVNSMINVWFEESESNEITEFMTGFIFSSGAFGTYERNALARAVKTTKKTGSSKKARIKELWKIVFLPYRNMCSKYPILKKMPVLLPFMWIVRGASATLFHKKKLQKLNISLEMVTVENIEAYQQALNLVGLDFDYKE